LNCPKYLLSFCIYLSPKAFFFITGIQDITSPSDKSVNCNSVNSNFLDLSGRRLPSLPIRKGIYIKDGRKVLIK